MIRKCNKATTYNEHNKWQVRSEGVEEEVEGGEGVEVAT